MRVLVTGAAGFIGMHVSLALLKRGDTVLGFDNLNDYYDVGLKHARLRELQRHRAFDFERVDLAEPVALRAALARADADRVVHLAAQAGVRHSIEHPDAYVDSNLVGFANLIEACARRGSTHFVYASSSSVYGGNTKLPFAEDDPVDHPVSFYAATKKANELMAHSYAHLHGLPATGLRFFTVYGPWGRPDMAYYAFSRSICAGKAIAVYNHGRMSRDFTYIDDIVQGVLAVLDTPPERAGTVAPHRVLNIGSHAPVPLMEFIATLGRALGRTPQMDLQPMQSGDVTATYADVTRLQRLMQAQGLSFEPTPLEVGLRRFVDWFQTYHGVERQTSALSA